MNELEEFLASGILELYVLRETSEKDDDEVEEMLRLYPEIIAGEIMEIGEIQERIALENPIEPDPIIRPFLLATIDYMTRLKNGEPFAVAPELSENSMIQEYNEFIERKDMVAPEDFEGIFAKIISAVPDKMITAIVWLREMAPQEVHDDEFERFLILEGTCEITIGNEVHALGRGNYLQIPLHRNHHVIVTSIIPCKILLQRVKVAA